MHEVCMKMWIRGFGKSKLEAHNDWAKKFSDLLCDVIKENVQEKAEGEARIFVKVK